MIWCSKAIFDIPGLGIVSIPFIWGDKCPHHQVESLSRLCETPLESPWWDCTPQHTTWYHIPVHIIWCSYHTGYPVNHSKLPYHVTPTRHLISSTPHHSLICIRLFRGRPDDKAWLASQSSHVEMSLFCLFPLPFFRESSCWLSWILFFEFVSFFPRLLFHLGPVQTTLTLSGKLSETKKEKQN